MADSYGHDEVEAALNGAFSDPRFRPGMRLLVDARETTMPVSAAEIERRLDLYSSLPERGLFPRVAFLLRSERWPLVSLSHSYFKPPLHPGELDLRVFADETEAIGWLER